MNVWMLFLVILFVVVVVVVVVLGGGCGYGWMDGWWVDG
jgi:hypothetical protein